MNKLLLFVSLLGFTAKAENIMIGGFGTHSAQVAQHDDEWCENNAGRTGSGYAVCGVGRGSDESSALQSAFRSGVSEFEKVCSMSADCNGRAKSVETGRSNCSSNGRSTICHRLILVTFLK